MKKNWIPIFLLFITGCGLTASCGVVRIQSLFTPTWTPAPPTETIETPTMTVTATKEIIWFPPTETPEPITMPTAAPTENMKPQVGKLNLEDNFSDEVPKWQTFRSDTGNAALANHELTLAIQDSNSSITSQSELPIFSDFYMTLNVTLSLCKDSNDFYGVRFRMADGENFYLWRINCLGQTSLLRTYRGSPLIIHDWTASGQVSPGAPQKFTIGILADGNYLRFFLNDLFQYEIHDTVFSAGGFGLSASSDGTEPLTVSFSKLQIYDLK